MIYNQFCGLFPLQTYILVFLRQRIYKTIQQYLQFYNQTVLLFEYVAYFAIMGNNIYETLTELGIPYKEHAHRAVFTVEESLVHCAGIRGFHTKNLFVRNKKGDTHYVVIVEHKNWFSLEIWKSCLAKGI